VTRQFPVVPPPVGPPLPHHLGARARAALLTRLVPLRRLAGAGARRERRAHIPALLATGLVVCAAPAHQGQSASLWQRGSFPFHFISGHKIGCHNSRFAKANSKSYFFSFQNRLAIFFSLPPLTQGTDSQEEALPMAATRRRESGKQLDSSR
jgi:hypothetical protein